MEPTGVIEVMGTELHYHEEGSGEPVLLLVAPGALDALTYARRSLSEELESYLCRVGRNPWFRRTTLSWIRRNRVLLEGARRVTVQHLLSEIRCPTRVLWGEADPLVPRAQTRLAWSIPGANITLLPRCGHLPMWEQREPFHTWLLESVAGGESALYPAGGGGLC